MIHSIFNLSTHKYLHLVSNFLVYKAESIKNENAFIKELRFLLSGITLDGNLYKPTFKQELDIQMYLNSYGWVVNEQYTIAVNLDVDVLDLDHLRLLA